MILDDEFIRTSFRTAWISSESDSANAHEEGGFVVRQADGTLFVIGWPHGLQNEIFVPPHSGGRRATMPIVATFHTHPNSGPGFSQEPSLTDIRAVRDDPDLSHNEYEGEFVISKNLIYLIRRSGEVEVIGETRLVLKLSDVEA